MIDSLNGVKVVDLSRVLAGPWAGQTLADLGAEVIKIEKPGTGDDTRSWGPPFVADVSADKSFSAAYYHCCNRGKFSVEVDIKTDVGQDFIHNLIKDADVVIENFKVGQLKRFNLDYISLSKINPGLVYCSITGFGQSGPYADRAGYDFIIQGMSGIMSLTGEADGEPQKVGVAFADIFTGLYSVIGILAATIEAKKTGKGQWLDMALLDCQIAVLANQAMNYLVTGNAPTRLGNIHPNISPYETFPTIDGNIIIAVGNDNQFKALCEVLACSQLSDDPLFKTNRDRVINRSVLHPNLANLTCKWQRHDLLAACDRAGVPVGPIFNLDETFANEQVRHRQIVQTLKLGNGATVPSVSNPIRFVGRETRTYRSSPSLGQHNKRYNAPG